MSSSAELTPSSKQGVLIGFHLGTRLFSRINKCHQLRRQTTNTSSLGTCWSLFTTNSSYDINTYVPSKLVTYGVGNQETFLVPLLILLYTTDLPDNHTIICKGVPPQQNYLISYRPHVEYAYVVLDRHTKVNTNKFEKMS